MRTFQTAEFWGWFSFSEPGPSRLDDEEQAVSQEVEDTGQGIEDHSHHQGPQEGGHPGSARNGRCGLVLFWDDVFKIPMEQMVCLWKEGDAGDVGGEESLCVFEGGGGGGWQYTRFDYLYENKCMYLYIKSHNKKFNLFFRICLDIIHPHLETPLHFHAGSLFLCPSPTPPSITHH